MPLITSWARARGVKVEARWNCQRTTTLHYMLVDPATRAALETQMVNAAVASNWDGINIDFEAGAAADRGLLTTFITELANALHAQGKTLSMEASAKVKDVPNHPARRSSTTTRSPSTPTRSSSCAGGSTGRRRGPARSTT